MECKDAPVTPAPTSNNDRGGDFATISPATSAVQTASPNDATDNNGGGGGGATPVTPAPTSSNGDSGSGDRGGEFATTSPTTDVFVQTASPTVATDNGGGGGGGAAPVTPLTPPTTVGGNNDRSGSDGGLSTAEAVGIGVGVSALAIVGVVGVARWRAGASG